MEWQFLSKSPEQTVALGNAVARHMTGEMVIALIGPLGAGKTLLTKGIAAANAGAPVEVTSPTFTLVQEYPGRLTIFHFDVYRLAKPDDPLLMALDEMVRSDAVVVIEWADRIQASLDYDTLWMNFEPKGDTARLITLQARGTKAQQCLESLRAQFIDTPATHP